MQITPHIHCLRIDFQVTPELHRFVYVFLIIGEKIHMVDAGVAGSEKAVADYLASLGRSIGEVSHLFLTHSHPDHIGGAAAIKRLAGCKVLASAMERDWIEDVEQQFKDRPIPNFHNLLNESVTIDQFIQEDDVISCESGITMEVVDTPGHSHGSQCFLFREEHALFSGDAIPVPGDIPIYVNAAQCEASLNKLLAIEGIDWYLSAWNEPKNTTSGKQSILLALEKQAAIDAAVRQALSSLPDATPVKQFQTVCALLHLEHLKGNPLFLKSISVHLQEIKG